MNEPIATRPHMPGYGTLPAGEGRGLLPWSWAQERLHRSHDFWLATVSQDGVPHLMPVWAVWLDGQLWFSSANESRKARNLRSEPA
jgi:nitroimidazol reductase NimA-like FMN-containing flavoprotein (pyridoxamine 5'-phosphate oxidase superfamily)